MREIKVDRVKVVHPRHFSPARLSLERLVEVAAIAWPDDLQRASVLGGKLHQIGGSYLIPKALTATPGFSWAETSAKLQHISRMAETLAKELQSLNPIHALLLEMLYGPEGTSPSPGDMHELASAAAKLSGETGQLKRGRRANPLPVITVRQLVSTLDHELAQAHSAAGAAALPRAVSRLRGRIVREWFAEVDITVTDKTRQRWLAAAREQLRREPALAESDRKAVDQLYLLSLGTVKLLP